MNRISPKKLQHSKWTAVEPRKKEKHFLVTAVTHDEEGTVNSCVLEAVYSRRQLEIDWRELKDSGRWRTGWQ